MGGSIFSIVAVLVAVILAVLALVLPAHLQPDVDLLIKFFEVMLPVLGVGALIKYLCCCKKKCDK